MYASFRLGRAELAEKVSTGSSRVTAARLLRQGAYFQSSYKVARRSHVIEARLKVSEKIEHAADRWILTIHALPGETGGLLEATQQSQSYYRFMHRLGRMGLETDANVTALFFPEETLGWTPELPMPIEFPGDAFTHMMGLTLARMGDLDEIVYEVSVRQPRKGVRRVDVNFEYRTTLNVTIVAEMLGRATQILGMIKTAPANEKTPAEREE